MFGEGRFHLIPSFFRALIFLKKQKREFSVLLRSFDQSYLDKVTWEFNKFCTGQHPCFSGHNGTPLILFDGSKGTKDMRIKNDLQKASYFRQSNELTDSRLLIGRYHRDTKGDFDKVLQNMKDDIRYENCEMIYDSAQ